VHWCRSVDRSRAACNRQRQRFRRRRKAGGDESNRLLLSIKLPGNETKPARHVDGSRTRRAMLTGGVSRKNGSGDGNESVGVGDGQTPLTTDVHQPPSRCAAPSILKPMNREARTIAVAHSSRDTLNITIACHELQANCNGLERKSQ